ncbi:hypothetical protein [Clostridium algidicarnis]|uniref:hypothetical protein n=1 Tax=Clostridium algidicarnis TaxID=37659 RepID=UPI001C0D58A7|nr:hypothetical protein [Clostridium algidicarnis]MBU3193455.1 hypothetical protein [Clostridium algidicarnis]MBU3203140.1 hypothetical protein [Clostridium algidicarnis]MBU3211294.1 hypothetical protein [Clostridium algidicarnis]MBU3222198.1 hypothetical protein [Clostridium algidicarnis]
MASKNIQMKIKSGVGWDELFPKTKATVTELADGKTVEQTITEILGILSTKVTSAEVENKIKIIVGSAPAALDTLQEIATALNNDANFAGTMTTLMSKKVDKVEGKQLSTEDFTSALKTKIESLKINPDGTAQVIQYTHPVSHPATMITEDVNRRFATDSEKGVWNSKTKISIGAIEDKSADMWFQEI